MLGKKFETLLIERNITMARLGKDLGVSSKAVKAWKDGESEPTKEQLERMAEILNVSSAAIEETPGVPFIEGETRPLQVAADSTNKNENMASEKVEAFRKMTDTELANYYVDVCAYNTKPAIDEQIDIRKEMADRFIDKFADMPNR